MVSIKPDTSMKSIVNSSLAPALQNDMHDTA
jgi:hypothetical protein